MPKVSQDHADKRRKQILDAASRCFARLGFHMATMQDVIREAKLSAGAIYNYFGGKNDIVLAIAHERHVRENAAAAEAAKEKDAQAVMERLVRDFFGMLMDKTRRDDRRVSVELWAEALHNDEIRASVIEGFETPRKLVAKMAKELKARGDLPRDVSPEAVSRLAIAIYQGFVLQMCWDEKVDVKAYMRAVEVIVGRLVER